MSEIPLFLFTLNCGKEKLFAQEFVERVGTALPEHPCDLYVFAFQEICSTMDGSFAEVAKSHLISNNRVVLDTLKARYNGSYNFTTVGLQNMGAIGIVAITPFPLKFRDTRFATASCGYLMSLLKGGVGLRTRYVQPGKEPTDLTFVSAHLAANEGDFHYQTRVSNILTIMRALDFGDGFSYIKPRSHAVFMGDLNFRTTKNPNDQATVLRLVQLQDRQDLGNDTEIELLFRQHDELFAGRNSGDLFSGFAEACINFAPSYKFHPNTAIYNTKRSPLWCDRVLFQNTYKLRSPVIHSYNSLHTYMRSDHRPVYLHISLPIDPPETIIGHNGNLMVLPSSVPERHLRHKEQLGYDKGLRLQLADAADSISGPTSIYLKCTGIDKIQQLFIRRLSDAGIGYGLWLTTTPRGRVTLLAILVFAWFLHRLF